MRGRSVLQKKGKHTQREKDRADWGAKIKIWSESVGGKREGNLNTNSRRGIENTKKPKR